MPRGVYPRTANQLEAANRNLELGRSTQARAKAADSIRLLARDPAWRQRVADGTRAAMRREEVRSRHLSGLERAREEYGVNFQSGNGQPMGRVAIAVAARLLPLGFKLEFPVKTKGHGTRHTKIPPCYKVDYAHPRRLIAIELDGPSHRGPGMKDRDQKKTEVLRALGWRVWRLRHS
jgi:hypothetical protein